MRVSTSTTIPFKVIGDSLVEGLSDETIVLTLTNPSTNAVMGRTNAVAYIYDNDTNRVVYEDYTGNYNAASETFSVTHGMIFNPSYTKTQLPAPITFTLTDFYKAVSDKSNLKFFKVDGSKSVEKVFEEISNQI